MSRLACVLSVLLGYSLHAPAAEVEVPWPGPVHSRQPDFRGDPKLFAVSYRGRAAVGGGDWHHEEVHQNAAAWVRQGAVQADGKVRLGLVRLQAEIAGHQTAEALGRSILITVSARRTFNEVSWTVDLTPDAVAALRPDRVAADIDRLGTEVVVAATLGGEASLVYRLTFASAAHAQRGYVAARGFLAAPGGPATGGLLEKLKEAQCAVENHGLYVDSVGVPKGFNLTNRLALIRGGADVLAARELVSAAAAAVTPDAAVILKYATRPMHHLTAVAAAADRVPAHHTRWQEYWTAKARPAAANKPRATITVRLRDGRWLHCVEPPPPVPAAQHLVLVEGDQPPAQGRTISVAEQARMLDPLVGRDTEGLTVQPLHLLPNPGWVQQPVGRFRWVWLAADGLPPGVQPIRNAHTDR